jgi:hypothetical protein
MITYECKVRINRHGEYENTEFYYAQIPEETPEDDVVEKLMDELRDFLYDDYEDDDDWENGDIDWTLSEWEKTEY